MSLDPIALARQLINCPSVTPARGEVFDVLESALEPLGFTVHRWVMGEPPDGPTENMVAIRGDGSPHFGFAGHLDVVPPGEGWSGDPFAADVVDGLLTGRGANDMKSAIAAYVAALSRIGDTKGTLSLLITGDEEGYSTWGTPRIIDWLNERQIRSATPSRSAAAARSTCGSKRPACRATSLTRTERRTRSLPSPGSSPRWTLSTSTMAPTRSRHPTSSSPASTRRRMSAT